MMDVANADIRQLGKSGTRSSPMARRYRFLLFYSANWAQTLRRKRRASVDIWTCSRHGRGATDNKGQVACWMSTLEVFQKTNHDVPISVRFCPEGMEESGSEGLDMLFFAQKDTFFKDGDYVCNSDNYWLVKNKACITGHLLLFHRDGTQHRDLHWGACSGSHAQGHDRPHRLTGSLVDSKGKVLIPGINEEVAPMTEEELELNKTDMDLEEYARDVGAETLLHNCKNDTLMHRRRSRPSPSTD
ncbi:Cytosolic non-specific dipeptidase [Camelus dromedarius]|uniref:Cytosolic non-specific dipeptidase n=1 Tax=Camelus dromedarius TaxID=9838 RepID=A0A5N4DXS9_CAMDR|nr:Cytosolic non-specific dipeptidase [Camelus dromedarius]